MLGPQCMLRYVSHTSAVMPQYALYNTTRSAFTHIIFNAVFPSSFSQVGRRNFCISLRSCQTINKKQDHQNDIELDMCPDIFA